MTYTFSERVLKQFKAHSIISIRPILRSSFRAATAILLATSAITSAQELPQSSATDISWEEIAAIKAQLEQEKHQIQILRQAQQEIQIDNGTQTPIAILDPQNISIEDQSYLAALERLQTEKSNSEALGITDDLQHTDMNQQAKIDSTQQSPFQQQIDNLIEHSNTSTAGSLQDADIRYLESLNAL